MLVYTRTVAVDAIDMSFAPCGCGMVSQARNWLLSLTRAVSETDGAGGGCRPLLCRSLPQAAEPRPTSVFRLLAIGGGMGIIRIGRLSLWIRTPPT
jgi:hypothetical protein